MNDTLRRSHFDEIRMARSLGQVLPVKDVSAPDYEWATVLDALEADSLATGLIPNPCVFASVVDEQCYQMADDADFGTRWEIPGTEQRLVYTRRGDWFLVPRLSDSDYYPDEKTVAQMIPYWASLIADFVSDCLGKDEYDSPIGEWLQYDCKFSPGTHARSVGLDPEWRLPSMSSYSTHLVNGIYQANVEAGILLGVDPVIAFETVRSC
jgi:hypothetical protein